MIAVSETITKFEICRLLAHKPLYLLIPFYEKHGADTSDKSKVEEIHLFHFYTCLEEVGFPNQPKKQMLVLLTKSSKPPGSPSSYHSLSSVDSIGKQWKRIIYIRLLPTVNETEGTSKPQKSLRTIQSTVDAMVYLVKDAIAGKRYLDDTKNIVLSIPAIYGMLITLRNKSML